MKILGVREDMLLILKLWKIREYENKGINEINKTNYKSLQFNINLYLLWIWTISIAKSGKFTWRVHILSVNTSKYNVYTQRYLHMYICIYLQHIMFLKSYLQVLIYFLICEKCLA